MDCLDRMNNGENTIVNSEILSLLTKQKECAFGVGLVHVTCRGSLKMIRNSNPQRELGQTLTNPK